MGSRIAFERPFRHTDIFRHKPGVKTDREPIGKTMLHFMVKGFSFHLPLFILLLITWLIYLWIAHAS